MTLSTLMPCGVRGPDNRAARPTVSWSCCGTSADPAKERIELALEWERRWDEGEGRTNVGELCHELGIGRDTAYVWLAR